LALGARTEQRQHPSWLMHDYRFVVEHAQTPSMSHKKHQKKGIERSIESEVLKKCYVLAI